MSSAKIFYFIPNLQQGGTEKQILYLMARLPSRYQGVLCVYHADNIFFDAECPPGQPAYSLGTSRMNLRALDRLTEILRAEKPSIVHSYRDKSNFWARLAARRAGIPIVITSCRNRMMKLRYLLIERLLSRYTTLTLTNSVGIEHELTKYVRMSPDKIRVIHNIIDVNRFRPPSPAERTAARQRWGLQPDDRVLLLPGRIGLQKHQAGLLWALRALARRGEVPANTVLLLAGRERDRIPSALAHWLASDRQLAPHVRFLGAAKEIESLYWAADVLVLPSLYEGLANAALEGCAAGLPAILSHAANVDGIIQDGVSGWEVPTISLAALARALGVALAAPGEDLRAMGTAARAGVVARFAPHENYVVDQTVAIYDELTAGLAARQQPQA